MPSRLDRDGLRVAVVVERFVCEETLVDVKTLPLLTIEGLREVLLQLLVLHAVVLSSW